jgi:hypothetical protein
MATAAKKAPKVTPIQKGNMNILRNDMTNALRDVMAKHGLSVDVGRITFIPGTELRCKVTVVQGVPVVNTVSNTVPVVGENWRFAGKLYRVESVAGNSVIVSRPSRARGARFEAGRGYVSNFRITLGQLMTSGVKVK